MGIIQKVGEMRRERVEQKNKMLSANDRINIRLLDHEMRRFYEKVQYTCKIKDSCSAENAKSALTKDARLLVETYHHDQREKEADRIYPEHIFDSREDLYEYYHERRDNITAQVCKHWVALNAVGLAVLAIRKGKDAAWTFGIANAIAVAEFTVRNERLNRRQEQAMSGWKLAWEYAAGEKISVAEVIEHHSTAGKGDDRARQRGIRSEYAD